MHSENLSISDSDDEDQSFQGPDIFAQNFANGASINETADSLKNKIDLDERLFDEAGPIVTDFYKNQLLKKRKFSKKDKKLEENNKIFGHLKNDIKVYPPNPPLYFLPSTIFITRKVKILEIRDKIIDEYDGECLVSYKKNLRQGEKLQVAIHTQNSLSFYVIKCLNVQLQYIHPNIHCFDYSLVLKPLFDYYSKNYDKQTKFSQTTGLLMYWAYKKKLLDEDYLSQDTIKLMIICFYNSLGLGISNIINIYSKQNKQEMEKMKKMYKINNKMDILLDQNLFDEDMAFSLKEQKGFYMVRLKKYSITRQILPIPYPVTEKSFKKYKNKCTNDDLNKVLPKNVHSISFFFRFLHYLNSFVQSSKSLKIDFIKQSTGYSSAFCESGFTLEVMHPVFENNICENLSNNIAKLKTVRFEIERAIQIFKDRNDPIEALKEIFQSK